MNTQSFQIFFCDVIGEKSRLNEAESSLRSLSLFFILLFSPSKEVLHVFAAISAYLEFFCSILLKLSVASAGILQLVLLLNSDSYSVFEFLGIDSVAIWKIRAFNSIFTLAGIFVLLLNETIPIFYYRLNRVSVPANTWYKFHQP
jgi:hypothetical protein